MKLIYLEWLDASYEADEKRIADLSPQVKIASAGFLVTETANYYTLAIDCRVEDVPLEEKQWEHIIHIPKIAVVSEPKIFEA